MKTTNLFLLVAIILVAMSCKQKNNPETTQQYANAGMWSELPTSNKADVDVFYVVSTCIMHSYLPGPDSIEVYTAQLTDEEKKILDVEIGQVKKEIFPDSLNFYAPYYHQTTMAAADTMPYDSLVVYSMKTQKEIAEAFDYYMAHYNQGRPFIVAGYSQGAIMTTSLLRHMTDEQFKRLVVAYVMGYGLNAEAVKHPHIVPATGAYDTGVTISFNSMDSATHVWDLVQNNAVTCINPINWRTDSTAADFVFDKEDMNVYVDTTIHGLIVSGFNIKNHPWIKEWEINPFPKGNYHNYEITFYNEYLRKNALERCRRFLSKPE